MCSAQFPSYPNNFQASLHQSSHVFQCILNYGGIGCFDEFEAVRTRNNVYACLSLEISNLPSKYYFELIFQALKPSRYFLYFICSCQKQIMRMKSPNNLFSLKRCLDFMTGYLCIECLEICNCHLIWFSQWIILVLRLY